MKAYNLKFKFGAKAFYEACLYGFKSGQVTSMKGAINYAEFILVNP